MASVSPSTTSQTGSRRAPGPRGNPLLGSALEIRKDLIGFLRQVTSEYGDIVRLKVAGSTVHLVNHPDYLRQVMQGNHRNYDKQSHEYQPLKMAFGQGLFTNDGEPWRRQRRLMQPAFHHQRVEQLGEGIVRDVADRMQNWHPYAQRGEVLDVAAEMESLSMNVATKALFSTGLRDNEAAKIGANLETIVSYCLDRAMSPLAVPRQVPTPRNRAFNRAMHELNTIIYRILDERRRDTTGTTDLVSMLLEVRDEETGEGISDKQMRDEIATLLLGGYETTSNLLSWTWYELSRNPAVEEKLHAEIDEVLDGRFPTVADLPRLVYTQMVLDETMRLYPVPWLERRAISADQIGGYDIPAKSLIYISPYLAHRHPDFWPDPERYDPERFAPDKPHDRPRFAYFPFGGGPRQCIGKGLALLEAQVSLAAIAQQYRLRPVAGHPVEPKMMITTVPRYGLPVTLQARQAKA